MENGERERKMVMANYNAKISQYMVNGRIIRLNKKFL